ncbi:MAG: hypothetical protein M1820_007416 [Bogoriella megaspora]|nr:MAG: hypothetical protein M1820_007416 [Bogoriella megaspora]
MEKEEIQQHLATIQQQDEHRFDWLQKLFRTYCDTADKLKDAVTDVNNERILSQLERSINRSAFVLVLIDADNDGYVFDDRYLLRGTHGGREAALALKSELQRELRNESPAVAELPFLIKLYANVDKLGDAMLRHGMHEASNRLRDFCRGFCQTGGLSEFIDVGDGDDRADHQIKGEEILVSFNSWRAKRSAGVLQHFQENPCCKHIVLGSCHDNGYVCHLDIIRSRDSLRDRITLLKSFQTGRQYSDLPFKFIYLPSLFRTKTFSAPVQSNVAVAHPAPTNSLKNGTVPSGSALSYAARAYASDSSPVKPGLTPPTNPSKHAVILLNAKGQRLDRLLKKPPRGTFVNFHGKKRKLEATGKRGPCHSHYLGGGCPMLAGSLNDVHRTKQGKAVNKVNITPNTKCPWFFSPHGAVY